MICGAELYIPVRFKLCPKCDAEIPASSLRCAYCDVLLIDRDEAFAAGAKD
jgi:hypothetical protein